jgi:hypothetical protein
MSRLALAAPLLPLFCFGGCLAFSRVPWSVTEPLAPGNDVAHAMIRLLPLPLAAVGVSVLALIRIARRPDELKGLSHALLGLALNLGVLFVAVVLAWAGDLS